MRILLLMDPFIPVPPEHYGGIERVIFDLAIKYAELGHQVTIVAGPGSKSPDRLIIYGENGNLSPKINTSLLIDVYSILYNEIKRHDVIHNFGRLAFLAPFLKHKIRKVQTYMRNVNVKNIERFDTVKPKNLVFTGVSNAIVTTGQTKRSNWHTVYNCSAVDDFDFKRDTDPNGYLAFLGRIDRCKGLHNAIQVARLTKKQLIIAGTISYLPHEKYYFESEIKPLIDQQQIKYIGPVNNIQKNLFLGEASALLTPVEWFEPFPIIIPESYACGTPVLGFNQGGISEGINHGVTGFVSETVSEMSEQVPDIPRLSRSQCRTAAEKSFSSAKIANDYLKLYSH